MRRKSPAAAWSPLGALCLVFIFSCWAVPRSASADDRLLYSANGMLERGLYDLAIDEYDAYLDTEPTGDDALTALYGRSVCLFRLGRLDEAASGLEHVVETEEFDFVQDALFLLAHCRVRGDQPDEAVEHLDRMLDLGSTHPSASEARMLLVESLYRAGRHQRAEREADRFLRDVTGSAGRHRILLFRGLAIMELDRPANAVESFEAIIEDDPDDALADQAMLLLAEALVADSREEEAETWFERVVEREHPAVMSRALYGLGALQFRSEAWDESSSTLDRLLDDMPKASEAPAARLLRGRIALEHNDLDEADRFLRELRDSEELEDDAAYWRAKVALRSGNASGAVEILEEAMESFEGSSLQPEMSYDRAVALARLEDTDRTMTAFADFVRTNPDHALADDAVYHVASLMHDAGRYEESLEALEILSTRYEGGDRPGDAAFLVAENEYMLERFDRALDAYQAFLAEQPDHRRSETGRFRTGMCLARLDRFDEAEPYLAEAGQRAGSEPLYRSALLALGDGWFDEERWGEAEEALADFVDVAEADAPGLGDALIQLALARSRQQDYPGALEALDRLLDRGLGIHYAHALFERGQVLMGLERWDEAESSFELLLRESPRSRFIPFARRHLASLAQRDGDLARAAEYFASASESGEGAFATTALVDQAGVLIELGRDDEAVSLLDKAEAQGGSRDLFSRLTALRVIALSRLHECADAVAMAGRLSSRDRERLEPTLRDSLVYESARCFRELARTSEAREALGHLIEEGSEEQLVVHAMLDVAVMDMNEGDHTSAVRRLDELGGRLEAMGDRAPVELREHASYRRGVCAYETQRYRDAIAALSRFAETFNASSLAGSADLICGQSMMEVGRFEEALSHLERASDEKWSDEISSTAMLKTIEAHAALQQWARSEDAARTFLTAHPGSPLWFHARFGLGWARENQGRRTEAIEAYREVVARHEGPTAARAQFQIGECLYADKAFDDAIRELLRVDILYAYPEWSAAALYEAGRCFEESGRPSEARTQFEQVVRRFEDSSWARLAQDRLDVLTPDGVPGHRS